jgi:hypothetical protein
VAEATGNPEIALGQQPPGPPRPDGTPPK